MTPASNVLKQLNLARRAKHRECLQACQEFAEAHVQGFPWARDVKERIDSLYDQLAALDLEIACHDQQHGLFPDYHEE